MKRSHSLKAGLKSLNASDSDSLWYQWEFDRISVLLALILSISPYIGSSLTTSSASDRRLCIVLSPRDTTAQHAHSAANGRPRVTILVQPQSHATQFRFVDHFLASGDGVTQLRPIVARMKLQRFRQGAVRLSCCPTSATPS